MDSEGLLLAASDAFGFSFSFFLKKAQFWPVLCSSKPHYNAVGLTLCLAASDSVKVRDVSESRRGGEWMMQHRLCSSFPYPHCYYAGQHCQIGCFSPKA